MAGPESECNLHAAFEGLCYCELRLPPAVCCPSLSLPHIITVPFAHVGTRREDLGTDPWFLDNPRHRVILCASVIWIIVPCSHQPFYASLGKDKVRSTYNYIGSLVQHYAVFVL